MEFVTYEQDGYVGIITINRPKALNALNSAVLEELGVMAEAAAAIVVLGRLLGEDHRAHGAVEQENALVEQLLEQGGGADVAGYPHQKTILEGYRKELE